MHSISTDTRCRHRVTGEVAALSPSACSVPAPAEAGVHRLAASALKFLLCGAAGRCWRTHCQARVAAHASGATPSHCACIAPRFCCGQRLRCAFVVQNLPSRPHTPAATKFDRVCIVALRTSNCSTLPCALDQSRSPPRGWPPARSDLPRNDIALTHGVERPAQPS